MLWPALLIFFAKVSLCITPSSEVSFLQSLYQNTQGDQWFTNTNWNQGDPCDNYWFGITCTPQIDGSTIVSSISLESNRLVGPIPEDIGVMQNLLILQLNNNTLKGEIPRSIGELKSLQELRLRKNSLEGQIPAEIGGLTSVQYIEIEENYFSGHMPGEIGQLTNLRYLDIDSGSISGPIPLSWVNLVQLEKVYIDWQALEGPLPVELTSWTNIQSFYVNNNKLSGTLPVEYAQLPLQKFRASNNALIGGFPEEYKNLTGLYNLWLHENDLGGELPYFFDNASIFYETFPAMPTDGWNISNNYWSSVPSWCGKEGTWQCFSKTVRHLVA